MECTYVNVIRLLFKEFTGPSERFRVFLLLQKKCFIIVVISYALLWNLRGALSMWHQCKDDGAVGNLHSKTDMLSSCILMDVQCLRKRTSKVHINSQFITALVATTRCAGLVHYAKDMTSQAFLSYFFFNSNRASAIVIRRNPYILKFWNFDVWRNRIANYWVSISTQSRCVGILLKFSSIWLPLRVRNSLEEGDSLVNLRLKRLLLTLPVLR